MVGTRPHAHEAVSLGNALWGRGTWPGARSVGAHGAGRKGSGSLGWGTQCGVHRVGRKGWGDLGRLSSARPHGARCSQLHNSISRGRRRIRSGRKETEARRAASLASGPQEDGEGPRPRSQGGGSRPDQPQTVAGLDPGGAAGRPEGAAGQQGGGDVSGRARTQLPGRGPEGAQRAPCKHSRALGAEVAGRRVSVVRACRRAHAQRVPASQRPRHPHLRAGTSGPSLGRLCPPLSSSPPRSPAALAPAVTGLCPNHEVTEAARLGCLPGRGGVCGRSHAAVCARGPDWRQSEGPKWRAPLR